MAGTSSKTMNKADVIYPDSRHAALGAYTGFKGAAPQLMEQKLEKAPRINWSAADELVKDARAKKADKDCYFKVGLIGTTLVLRVKTQRSMAILGYEQQDAELATGCKLKEAPKGGGGSDTIAFGTYYVLTSGDCDGTFLQYLDIGKGYGINLSVTVDGAGKNPGLRARIKAIYEEYRDEIKRDAQAIAKSTGKTLQGLRVKSGSTLQGVAAEAQREFEALLDVAKLQKEFEARVTRMVAEDKEFKQHAREWRIKAAFKAVLTTVKLATAIARLVASHGAEVTAYLTIVKCAKAYYDLVTDFRKAEDEVAKELDESIDLYIRSSNDLAAEIARLYDENDIDGATGLGKIKAAGRLAGQVAQEVQGKISKLIKTYTGKHLLEKPEECRRRYLIELGKLIEKLDKQFKTLEGEMDKFFRSSIKDAVKAWPALQKLKAACAEALADLKAKKVYAEAAKKRIEALGIEVDDRTSLTKLKGLAAGIKGKNKTLVLDGTKQVASMALSLKGAYDAVNSLVDAVSEFV